MSSEGLFREPAEPMLADPAITRSTTTGPTCLRYDGRFFACPGRREQVLIVKSPRQRVAQLVEDGGGRPFAPAGKVFREWVALLEPHEQVWRDLLAEARASRPSPCRAR